MSKLNEILSKKKNELNEIKKCCPYCMGQNDNCSFIYGQYSPANESSPLYLGIDEKEAINLQGILKDFAAVEEIVDDRMLLKCEEFIYDKISMIEERVLQDTFKGKFVCSDMGKNMEGLSNEMKEIRDSARDFLSGCLEKAYITTA